MGWARTLLMGDIGNRLDIEDTERDIAKLKRQLRQSAKSDMSQDTKIERLQEENAELKLYLAALIRLLVDNGTITAEELANFINVLDAEDGEGDGKLEGDII